MKHEELMVFPQKSRITSSHSGGMTHVIQIHEDITEPSNWSDEFALINGASESDTVVLDLCTPGGDLYTAMLFVRSLNSCAAHTVAIIGPEVASAGSIIALSCREWILDDTSSLMIHTSSYGIMAKDTDIFEHANFSRQQLKRLYENVYSGFLSADELSDVIKGTPFYFDAEHIADRLDNLQEYRKSLPCPCGNSECGKQPTGPDEQEDFEDMPTLDEMISSAVAAGIEQYEKKRLAAEKKASRTKPVKVVGEK
jgi:ATP-dependent protease ClpP protease subunit